jgi:hypothetical protein
MERVRGRNGPAAGRGVAILSLLGSATWVRRGVAGWVPMRGQSHGECFGTGAAVNRRFAFLSPFLRFTFRLDKPVRTVILRAWFPQSARGPGSNPNSIGRDCRASP